jgi:hypothetical protein
MLGPKEERRIYIVMCKILNTHNPSSFISLFKNTTTKGAISSRKLKHREE